MSDRVLSLDEAAHRAGIVRRTLDRLRAVGEAPPIIQLSPRRVGIMESDLLAWLAARRVPAPTTTVTRARSRGRAAVGGVQ